MDFKVGDTIKCNDNYDLLQTHLELELQGYDTEFVYEKGSEKGYWLVIEGVPNEC